MARFPVVAGSRGMSVTDVITMCPAIVVVETVVFFWRIAWRAILTVSSIVAAKISCKALCFLSAFDDFALVPIEF